jgi:hypothetical protein
MDPEGIDALDAENEHDVRIFALSVLKSSIFVNTWNHSSLLWTPLSMRLTNQRRGAKKS